MIKGLAITPPILGRISIGKVVEKDGKRLPEKDDQFTLTTLVQNKDGWMMHPFDEQLRNGQANRKIRAIPIRLLFNEPDLNLRASYALFDRRTGRPLCTGNGEVCRRFTASGMATLACPSPDGCELAQTGCKPFGRLNVRIGEDEEDLGTFIFRTTGFNSIRTLAARLAYYRAMSGDLLACLPLALRLRARSTTMSHRAPIYYADITVRDGRTLEDTLAEARELHARRTAVGYDQAALDAAASLGFANGAFEETVEEVGEIVDEFFPGGDGGGSEVSGGGGDGAGVAKAKPTLRDKLDQKAAGLTGERA